MNSKELFKALFNKQEMSRPLFIPLICSYAARLRQISVQEMFGNPTIYANSLRETYQLFGFDVITNTFDPSMEAEALGCKIEWDREDQPPKVVSHPLAEGEDLADLGPEWEKKCRIPMILDITKRLTMLLGKGAAVIGVITGPLTLARHLQGEGIFTKLREDTPYSGEVLNFASQCCLKLARLYAELKVDGILMVEEYFDRIEDSLVRKLGIGFLSVWNMLHYFGIPLLLLGKGCDEEKALETIGTLQADGLILDARSDSRRVKEAAQDHNLCLAATIPTELLLADPKIIRDILSENLSEAHQIKGGFLSTEWEIPYHTPPQNIHEIMKVIKGKKKEKRDGGIFS